jgi:hypothetical protein
LYNPSAPSRFPFAKWAEVDGMLEEIKRVTKKSCSPWSSSIVFIRKMNADLWFHVDY